MSTFNWKEIPPLKFLFSLVPTKKKPKSESPWLEGLDSLAERYGEDPMRPTTYKTAASTEAEEQLRQLCNEVQEGLEENDRVMVRRDRRQNATTAVDLKAWWGGAVATWDPNIDSKNLDSIEQQRRPRRAKWFDQPGNKTDLGRPSK